MSDTTQLPIAITCGDPAGVGPEVVAMWAGQNPSIAARCAFIGPRRWCGSLPGIGVPVGDIEAVPGVPTAEGAALACAAREEAARGCAEGRYSGVVTAPISKEWMARAGFPFPGHTEFFADRWGGVPTMAFVGERLKLALATWHIPLMEVSAALTDECLGRAVERAVHLARAYGAREPRIAVCGLNPHAGEGGMMGKEERDRLDPALDRMRRRLPGLSRCLPPDTVFHRLLAGEFDAAVALYHDQGLGPLKTLEFDSAVNVTLGLAHVRTSPDHGTAFGIAGKGLASEKSFANAVRVAQRLTGAVD